MHLHKAAQYLQRLLADDSHPALRHSARSAFSPQLSYGRHFGNPRPKSKAAAVLAMLQPSQNTGQLIIPLTVRPMHLPDHPGQVSLPGGRLEGDESYAAAAEREYCEELGIAEFPGEIIGELLPLYVYNSDYFVRAFVGICDSPQTYRPCDYEVDSVVELPVDHLLHTEPEHSEFSRGRITWHAPTIHYQRTTIWGATAIILGELRHLLSTASK